MAQLAIKGHATRGKEVIEILEMLGGKTRYDKFEGHELSCGYYIKVDGYIGFKHYSLFDDTTIFTLEEFLEKYPYKVGDKVKAWVNEYYDVFDIQDIRWVNLANEVGYKIHGHWYSVRNLQPYKEQEIMYLNEKANKQAEEIAKILEPAKEIMEGVYAYNEINCYHQDFGDKVRIRLGNDFEIKVEDKITYIVKKKPQYPKTYEECCKIIDYNLEGTTIIGYNKSLLENFQQLLICRDAYWKIAGEQMGMSEPWKPDFLNPTNEIRYFIFCTGISIEKGQGLFSSNKILIFPTEEMCDAFYEKFKELIELCKELL